MNAFFTSIIVSSLLIAPCPFVLAASDQGLVDIGKMKLFNEFKYSVTYGKNLYLDHCRNQISNHFQEVYNDMTGLQYVDVIECQISSDKSIYILGISSNDEELCKGGKCGVVTITMETITGSLYSGKEFFLLPLAGDSSVSIVTNTPGTESIKGEGGSIVSDEDAYISGWCIATGNAEDKYGVISLKTSALGDILLADVLGVNACTMNNDY